MSTLDADFAMMNGQDHVLRYLVAVEGHRIDTTSPAFQVKIFCEWTFQHITFSVLLCGYISCILLKYDGIIAAVFSIRTVDF